MTNVPQSSGKGPKRRARLGWVAVILCVVALLASSGRFLVVDRPIKSDVIVVLAGETDTRPARGLQLLDQGYAARLVLNVPANARVYHWTQSDLAEKYVEGLPEARAITICPIYGLSTKEEALDADRCLQGMGAARVLLVTSDYHTRRALSIFNREAPNHDYSIAAAPDAREFGTQWWRHREWAKVNFDEWIRLAWWALVDRWRSPTDTAGPRNKKGN
jgi:uncharacterized SAM-binding protein YcdF (DUF218 family)